MDANFDKSKMTPDKNAQVYACTMTQLTTDESYEMPNSNNMEAMAQTFGNSKKDRKLEKFPMSLKLIAKEQKRDKCLQKLVKVNSEKYNTTILEGVELIMFDKKNLVPLKLREKIIGWYHLYLRHPGQTQMEGTLCLLYTWPNLRKDVE